MILAPEVGLWGASGYLLADTSTMPVISAPSAPVRHALGWTLVLVGSAVFVKSTHIGPVVLVINAQRGWGVHSGDAWILAGLVPVAVCTAIALARRSRRQTGP